MRDKFDWFARYGDLLQTGPSPVAVPGQAATHVMLQEQAFRRMAYNREDHDCGVRALAVACAAPYEAAHQALMHEGRMPGTAVNIYMLIEAAQHLNYELVIVTEYEAPHRPTIKRCARTMCTMWGGYILLTRDHAAGMWDGEVIDWSRDRAFRVRQILRATTLTG